MTPTKRHKTQHSATLKATLRTILTLMLAMTALQLVNAQLLITGVQYDPDGADTGKEWVQIFNNAQTETSLDNVILQTGDGAQQGDWTDEWTGQGKLRAKQSIIVGETQWADVQTNLDLQNGPDAVRIKTTDGDILDTIGWGDHAYDEYYEGNPVNDGGDGYGLKRRCTFEDGWTCTDTDDNLNDTIAEFNLSPYHFSLYDAFVWDVQVDTTAPTLQNISVTDEVQDMAGVQWLGRTTTTNINISFDALGLNNQSLTIRITDQNNETIAEQVSNIDCNTCNMRTQLLLPSYLQPGDYEIRFEWQNSSLNQTQAQVLRFEAIEVEFIEQSRIDNDVIQVGLVQIQNKLNQPLNFSLGIAARYDNETPQAYIDDVVVPYGTAILVQLQENEQTSKVITLPLTNNIDEDTLDVQLVAWVDIT